MITFDIRQQRPATATTALVSNRAIGQPGSPSTYGNNPVSGDSPARRASGAEADLAAGVLRQAAADVRRFRGATDPLGRELYSDARGWFIAGDAGWPYSFLNVCSALRLSPDAVFDEVFADARASWYTQSRRVAARVARSARASVAKLLAPSPAQRIQAANS